MTVVPVSGLGGFGGVGGPDFKVGSLQEGTPIGDPAQGAGGGFGSVLVKQLSSLQGLQDNAAQAAQGLADGTVTDPSAAVMAVERARLAMQMASQMRTKGVEAMNDIFHTQV